MTPKESPAILKSWLDAGLNFFYPEVCQACGIARATPAEGFICAGCRAGVRFIRAPFCERCGLPYQGAITAAFECGNCQEMVLHFRQARAAVAATGLALDIIHRYKYQQALWFEPFLAGMLVRAAEPVLRSESWDLIVPVPLHPLKKREREFNQAERLAHCLSQATGLTVAAGLIQRVAATRTQTLLTRPERADNVRCAFAITPGRRLTGERIVLVDDVLTTGATTSACAHVLKKAGAGEVCVWTVARGL